jgi:hypothetical protein
MATGDIILDELKRRVDVLWRLANICPKCRKTPLQRGGTTDPPVYSVHSVHKRSAQVPIIILTFVQYSVANLQVKNRPVL